MEMVEQRDVLGHGVDDARREPAGRLRREATDRVGPRGSRRAGFEPGFEQFDEIVDVAAAAVLAAELDALDAVAARVSDGVALHADVRSTVERKRLIEPLALRFAFTREERLADLVLHVQIAARGENEKRH